jgi:hypothetical protein
MRGEQSVHLNFINHTIQFITKMMLSLLGITIVDSDLEWFVKVVLSAVIAAIISIGVFEYKRWRSKNDSKKID